MTWLRALIALVGSGACSTVSYGAGTSNAGIANTPVQAIVCP